MLKVQRRHRPPCKKPMWDAYTNCKCHVLIRGTLAGKRVTLSPAKFLPPDTAGDLEAARDLALLWERTGSAVRPPETALAPTPVVKEEERPGGYTIQHALASYMADGASRGNAPATLEKKRTIFTTGPQSLQKFAAEKGLRFVPELEIAILREWRDSWTVGSLVRSKRQKQAIGFLWFCERSGWLPRNTAHDITQALGRIKFQPTQTDCFTPEEYARIVDATALYSDRPSVDKHNSLVIGGQRIRAITELMRWTGLRIRCAATLEKERLTHDPRTGIWSVIVWQRKTGEGVYCPIPPDVAEMLINVPASQKGNTNEKYFFWTGNGNMKTVVANWQRSYGKLFKLAQLGKRAHPHMFRDTFAVESLLAGMTLQQVSTILGHSSIRITEQSYMPWVLSRQRNLNDAVQQSWIRQGKVKDPAAPAVPPKRAARASRVVPITRLG